MENKNEEKAVKVPYRNFTRSVEELEAYNFYVPSYQRGYRWTPLQVKQLLDDLYNFFERSLASWYCIQPLVVQAQNNSYVVVDGQQRLTTLSIVLNVLDGLLVSGGHAPEKIVPNRRPYQLSFERDKERTEETKAEKLLNGDLASVPNSIRNAYADNFCICESANVVRSWIVKRDMSRAAIETYAQNIRNRVRFIWYVADSDDETGYKVFERLNSGKIALSNAELIKALLLCKGNLNAFGGKSEDVVINEVAKEWDSIEQQLQKDDFWYFINPDAGDERFSATRIDFLFELMLRSEIRAAKERRAQESRAKNPYALEILYSENGSLQDWVREDDAVGANDDFDYAAANRANPYFAFYALMQSNCNLNNVWSVIKSIVNVIVRWYNDRRTYHLVGFLMNQKNSSIETLVELIYEVRTKSHSDFINNVLMKNVRQVIGFSGEKSYKDENGVLRNEEFECCLAGLSYEDKETNKRGKSRIYDVLLLFNIILMDRQCSELSRYPFAAHSKIKKGWNAGWSLEHIHAKQEEIVDSDLSDYEKFFSIAEVSRDLNARIKILNDSEHLNKYGLTLQWDHSVNPPKIRLMIIHDGLQPEDASVTHGIGNMALLDCARNAKFNNGSYIKKRTILAEWERGDRESNAQFIGDFVPVGTRMAFYKHYVKDLVSDFPLAWTYKNRNDYELTIARAITMFLTPEDTKMKGENE